MPERGITVHDLSRASLGPSSLLGIVQLESRPLWHFSNFPSLLVSVVFLPQQERA